jgi:hypothetical protein
MISLVHSSFKVKCFLNHTDIIFALGLDLSIQKDDSAMTEVIRDLELVNLFNKTNWEDDLVVITDVLLNGTSTESLVGDSLHVIDNFFAISFWRLFHHDLLELIKILDGILLEWHGVDVDLTRDQWEWGELWLLDGWSGFLLGVTLVKVFGGHEHGLGFVDRELEVNSVITASRGTVDFKDVVSRTEHSREIEVFGLGLLDLDLTV